MKAKERKAKIAEIKKKIHELNKMCEIFGGASSNVSVTIYKVDKETLTEPYFFPETSNLLEFFSEKIIDDEEGELVLFT